MFRTHSQADIKPLSLLFETHTQAYTNHLSLLFRTHSHADTKPLCLTFRTHIQADTKQLSLLFRCHSQANTNPLSQLFRTHAQADTKPLSLTSITLASYSIYAKLEPRPDRWLPCRGVHLFLLSKPLINTTNHIFKPLHSHHSLRTHLPATHSDITSLSQSLQPLPLTFSPHDTLFALSFSHTCYNPNPSYIPLTLTSNLPGPSSYFCVTFHLTNLSFRDNIKIYKTP
jgi:hypothetical protein